MLPAFELAGAGSAWVTRSRSTSESTCVIQHNQHRRIFFVSVRVSRSGRRHAWHWRLRHCTETHVQDTQHKLRTGLNRRSCRSKDLPPGIQPDCPCACLTLRTGLLVVLARYGLDASSPRERSYGSRPLRALPLTCSCMPAHRTVERCRCYPHWSNSTGSGEGAHSVAHEGNHLAFSKKTTKLVAHVEPMHKCMAQRQ